ncbi:obscurin-like [Lingula anatina]|uniref:Obscurin-like n=1 Tax=Lingula anatina TaxID=7574 RepID=A0A1S3I8W6_LINAN|nr:obscurin-like [Lingula anatina]|eukprot:XP_013394705.1 obscurin-like [Lingula anatina]
MSKYSYFSLKTTRQADCSRNNAQFPTDRTCDVPDRPGRPAVSQVSGTEVFLIWDAPKFDGNTHIIAYKVDYRPEGEERWTTASYTIDECALVTDLSPETEYRFRVSCLNRFGVSPYSWSSQEVTTKSAGEAPLSREKMRQCKKIDIQADADLSPELRDFESARERGEVPLIERNPAEDYEFAGELWRGNFSVVRSCGRKDMPATLAAKIIAYTPSNRSQVLHEFEILKTLNQERIVRLHEAFTTPDHLILIMDRLYGENILQFLSYKNKYTEETVAKVMRQVIDAVQYLHHQGVVHLNIQPDNVMMASRRRLDVRLGDFGCARIITDPMGEKMTQVGAPEFMSPEMACGEKVGFPSDVWQVGVLAFILLSGESPFLGENDEKTLENTRSVRYDSHSLYENITKDAFKYIQETLKREPSHRLTADELHEHPWLQLTEAMVKKREAARFVTNKLRQFADEYGKRRQADATKSEKLINAFGPPAGAAAVDSDSDGEFTPKSPIAVRKTSDQTQRQRHTEKQLVLPEPKGDSDSGITTQDSDTSSVDGRPIPKMTKRHR